MNLSAVLEGLLFMVGEEGLSREKAISILEIDKEELDNLIIKLKNSYDSDERGFKLEILGNNMKLTTKKEHKEYYERLVFEENDSCLSQAALETLAIIAYNAPVTRIQIDEIRGINSSHLIRKLLLKNLIKDIGRSDAPGRPILYDITNNFLDYFGLSTIAELPKFKNIEFEEKEANLFESKYKEQ